MGITEITDLQGFIVVFLHFLEFLWGPPFGLEITVLQGVIKVVLTFLGILWGGPFRLGINVFAMFYNILVTMWDPLGTPLWGPRYVPNFLARNPGPNIFGNLSFLKGFRGWKLLKCSAQYIRAPPARCLS